MSTVHVSLATNSPVPFTVVSKALGIRKSHSPECPSVFLDGDKTIRDDCIKDIGPIVREAKRRADLIRAMTCSDVGVGMARGPAQIRYNRGARLARFEFVVVVAVEESGIVAFCVPPIYPDEAYGAIVADTFAECDHFRSDAPRFEDAAAIAAIAWSRLDFPGVTFKVELLP